jgi:hypothetical protein
MAVPIRFAIDLLKKAGWKSPEEAQAAQNQTVANANISTQPKTP